MTAAKNVQKCSQIVRRIRLEIFRLATDGPKKWKSVAERRKHLLVLLSTWANGDGTFTRQLKNGEIRNFSPSEKTLLETIGCRASLYRLLDSLKDLNLLSWDRKDHHSIRQYTIHLPEQVSNHPDEQVSNQGSETKNRSQITLKTPENTSQITQEQVSQLVAPSVSYPSLEEPSKEREHTLASFSDTEKPDSEFVVKIAKKVSKRAKFTLKHKKAIDEVLSQTTVSRDDVAAIVRESVGSMDDFALNNAGNYMAAELAGTLDAVKEEKVEAAEEEAKTQKGFAVAQANIERQQEEYAEIAKRNLEAIPCGNCGQTSGCDCM